MSKTKRQALALVVFWGAAAALVSALLAWPDAALLVMGTVGAVAAFVCVSVVIAAAAGEGHK